MEIKPKGKKGCDIQGMGIKNMCKGRKSKKMRNREDCMDGWREKWKEREEGRKGMELN